MEISYSGRRRGKGRRLAIHLKGKGHSGGGATLTYFLEGEKQARCLLQGEKGRRKKGGCVFFTGENERRDPFGQKTPKKERTPAYLLLRGKASLGGEEKTEEF